MNMASVGVALGHFAVTHGSPTASTTDLRCAIVQESLTIGRGSRFTYSRTISYEPLEEGEVCVSDHQTSASMRVEGRAKTGNERIWEARTLSLCLSEK